jgi:hypothetical protein
VRSVHATYKNCLEIPRQAYSEAGVLLPRGEASLVTAEDVRAASDAWDARGILHDIDTQWGLIPGGGAYKDSDFYYGPED